MAKKCSYRQSQMSKLHKPREDPRLKNLNETNPNFPVAVALRDIFNRLVVVLPETQSEEVTIETPPMQ